VKRGRGFTNSGLHKILVSFCLRGLLQGFGPALGQWGEEGDEFNFNNATPSLARKPTLRCISVSHRPTQNGSDII